MATRYVILGAGPAGLNALETLRALDSGGRITLVCDEPPYARMVLPYLLGGSVQESALQTGDDAWFAEQGVETRFGVRARGVDAGAHRLTLEDGSALDYDRLLVATGSRAMRPEVEGADGDGVIPIWTLSDARGYLGGAHRETVIVGAGFIAFTILDAIVKTSERVHIVEIAPRVLPRMLDARAAALVEAQLAADGVGVRTGSTLQRIEPAGGRRRLRLSTGDPLECDAVVLATGVRPNLEFLAGSGLEIDQGILVDGRMQTSLADVYAAGDCAQGPDLLGGEPRVQAIQPTAVDHGRVAAANMAGHDVCYDGSLTMNVVAARGLEACSFGRWEGDADVTVVANESDRIYRKYVWEGDRMVGASLVGPSLAVTGVNDAGMLKGLIQSGVRLGPWRAYLDENPLDLRRPYLASGAAEQLLASTLLAGRVSSGEGFRFPKLPARRQRSGHHGVLVAGAPR
jgi:NAD(P)H-nitrite reductase large subunit